MKHGKEIYTVQATKI